MNFLEIRGGASIGWVSMTWPLAKLSVTRDQLRINGLGLASCVFEPRDIVALQPRGAMPAFVSNAIQITHTRPDLPEKIAFMTVGRSRDQLLADIAATGFRPSAAAKDVPARSGMAFRWSFVIVLALCWNILFLLDNLEVLSGFIASNGLEPRRIAPFGWLSLLAIASLFALAVLLPCFERLRTWAIRPGRHIGEVMPVINLVRLITGMMLFGMTMTFLTGTWTE